MSSRGLLIANITIAAVTDEVDALEVDLPWISDGSKGSLPRNGDHRHLGCPRFSRALALDADCANIFCSQ
jgi:hypothetical protein